MDDRLADLLKRAARWPEAAQRELVELADEIDRELTAGAYAGSWVDSYELTETDKAAIDEGLAAAREGRFATDAEVEAVFAKYRRG